jgi:hypothetical protein
MVFVPGEIPRRGAFALWGKGSGSAKVELVFPGGTYGIRKRLISADLLPLAEALPTLLAIDLDERAGRPVRHSVRVWAATRAGSVRGFCTAGCPCRAERRWWSGSRRVRYRCSCCR